LRKTRQLITVQYLRNFWINLRSLACTPAEEANFIEMAAEINRAALKV
jgi:hypothetical protein